MRIKAGIVSAIDQAWLSVLNLSISFAFIRFATKEDYGIYLLLLTPLYLMQGVQNAVILSPIATVLPAAAPEDKDKVMGTAVAAQVYFAIAGGVLAALGLGGYWLLQQGHLDTGLALGFGLAVAGVCAREGARVLFYSRGDAAKALASDLVYGIGLLLAIGACAWFRLLTPMAALLAMGVAALWPYAWRWAAARRLHLDRKVFAEFWACGRWALVGAVVSWINLSAYPLIVGLMLSTATVADINVARLFLMPIALLITAWSNLYRPRISGWTARGQAAQVKSFTLRSIGAGLGLLAVFTLVVAVGYPYAEPLLGPGYRGLLPLVSLWSLFFALNLSRSMLMATLMTSPAGYKQLQSVSWVALVVSVGGLLLLSARGPMWVVGVLIAVELAQCAIIVPKALRAWRTSAA